MQYLQRRHTEKEYLYSKERYGKALCRLDQRKNNQGVLKRQAHSSKPSPTPEARKLYAALKKFGVPATLEKFDGFKHIDIAIPKAKVNIEIDGGHHNFDYKQALADLKRTYYSFKRGYVTIRVPNSLVNEKLDETAKYLVEILNESVEQLEDDEF